jgi:hypothetical protein
MSQFLMVTQSSLLRSNSRVTSKCVTVYHGHEPFLITSKCCYTRDCEAVTSSHFQYLFYNYYMLSITCH